MDQILPVDFDGDLRASNNMSDAMGYPVSDTRPTVYFSVAESQGWYFIGYYFYHPVDRGFSVDGAEDLGHENDLEGVFFIVQKGLWGPYGEPLFALTQAHGAMVPFGWNQDAGYVMNNSLVSGDAHAYAGEIHFWNNPFSGHDHPVVAIRSSTHGTYMAQDCSDYGQSSYFYDGSGMWGPKSDAYTYRACWHDDSQWMLLEPAFGYNQDWVAPFGARDSTGVWDYRLVDLSTSVLWTNRLSSTAHGGIFFGTPQDIGGGQQGLPHFDASSYDPSNTADAMWAWVGGGGSCHWVLTFGGCWYTFHDDATGNFHRPAPWPGLTPGELLTDPASVARNFFPKFSSFSEAMLYNPYPVNPPPPPPPPQPNVSITGPTTINLPGQLGTWQAVVAGGTPPYQYQWSGAFSGTAQSVSGRLYSDDTLYLDVWDAAGAHVALSYYIQVGQGCQPPDPC